MNIKQKLVAHATAGALALSLFAPFATVHAATWKEQSAIYLNGVGQAAALGPADVTRLPVIIGNIINVVLSLLGLIFLGLALYAGFKWMTAQGDSKEIDTAKDTLRNAVIGIIIVVASYALSSFVMAQILIATA